MSIEFPSYRIRQAFLGYKMSEISITEFYIETSRRVADLNLGQLVTQQVVTNLKQIEIRKFLQEGDTVRLQTELESVLKKSGLSDNQVSRIRITRLIQDSIIDFQSYFLPGEHDLVSIGPGGVAIPKLW